MMKFKRILTPLLIILLLLSIVVMGAPTYVNVGPTTEFDGDIKIISEIVAEGITANEFETTLVFTDPTADRVITIPDSDQTLDLSLYYLKTAIDTEEEMEAIWGVGLAHSGANDDITSITGLTTALGAAYGGTGVANAAGETITLTGGFALDLTLTAATAITLPTTGTVAVTANKLSVFAATTSAELAGVISDEMGAGKARFDTAVTAKTSTATLTVAEAGTILVKSNIVTGTDIAFVDGGANEDTITSVANAFGGYAVGDSITITGATNAGNNSTFTLTGAVAGTLTVATASLTAEAAGASVTIKNAYTITLPTAVGNMGLTYHFIKTDANYILITIDGDGTETINYENATSAPCLTYPRLNTLCAEATLVSDNANWQVIAEALGQVPRCWAYLTNSQLNILDNLWGIIELDTLSYDIGSNSNVGTWVSSTATSTVGNHLVDSTAPFTAAMVGKRVKNTTDTTETYIIAYNSTSDVTVRDDIFVNTEAYEIKYSKYVIPISGSYEINIMVTFETPLVDKPCWGGVKKNATTWVFTPTQTTRLADKRFSINMTSPTSLSKNDYLELEYKHISAANTVDITQYLSNTYLSVRLISKD